MITVFELKPIVTKNGEKVVDMSYPSIRYNFDPYIVGVYAVNEHSEMRPDIISRSAYGITAFWDMILKYNGISNPFSISKEDRFFIPAIDDMRQNLSPVGVSDEIAKNIRAQYTDVSKKAKQDPRLAEVEKKRKEAQRKKVENIGVASVNNLPPNIAEEGDREIIIKGGKVQFGPNISRGEKECEKPLSKSEFIAKLIKNRLKGG